MSNDIFKPKSKIVINLKELKKADNYQELSFLTEQLVIKLDTATVGGLHINTIVNWE